MTAETSNARGELRVADIREDAREPLQLLREKLAHDEDGWAALCQLMPMLAAAPQPADAEVRARELLAACAGSAHVAEIIRSNPFAGGMIHIEHALRAIVAALSQQPEPKPEARGVVDEMSPRWMEEVCSAAADAMDANGLSARSQQLRRVAAALTETRNVR